MKHPIFHRVSLALAVALIALSTVLSSWQGALATCLGMVGTAVFLGGTWFVVRLVGEGAKAGSPRPRQVVLTVIALLLKLPLIYAGWMLAQGLGPLGPTWFLLGLALVYCAVIWRAVLAARD